MTGRILIVEDDRSMGEMLEADLRLRGLETIWRMCSIRSPGWRSGRNDRLGPHSSTALLSSVTVTW